MRTSPTTVPIAQRRATGPAPEERRSRATARAAIWYPSIQSDAYQVFTQLPIDAPIYAPKYLNEQYLLPYPGRDQDTGVRALALLTLKTPGGSLHPRLRCTNRR